MNTLPLPLHAYIPGTGSEPDRAVLERAKEMVPPKFNGFVPASHPALIYGLHLNDAGFFWESHEVLEAVWKAAPPGGRDRLCLRGCIQVANANLKLKTGKVHAALRLMAEAEAEFVELGVRGREDHDDCFANGFPAAALAGVLRTRAGQPNVSSPIMLGYASRS